MTPVGAHALGFILCPQWYPASYLSSFLDGGIPSVVLWGHLAAANSLHVSAMAASGSLFPSPRQST